MNESNLVALRQVGGKLLPQSGGRKVKTFNTISMLKSFPGRKCLNLLIEITSNDEWNFGSGNVIVDM